MISNLLTKIGFGLVLISAILGCSMKPRIILEAKQRGTDIDFDIQTKGINGLLDFRIWQTDTKEVIWQVNLNYFKGSRLSYGEVPTGFKTFNGGIGDAKQLVPLAGKRPTALPVGKSFVLALGGQHDTAMSAAIRTFYFSFSTDSEGRISPVLPVTVPSAENLPE